MKCSDTEYNGSPWEWRTLGVADPGGGGPWEGRPLGEADPNRRVQAANQSAWPPLPSGLPRERTGAMGDNPDRKSGRVPCRKGGVDRLHRNGQTLSPRLPGKWLGPWGNEPADEFSSELWLKVLRDATLVSGPTAAWGTAGFMDEETATLHRGQATDDGGALVESKPSDYSWVVGSNPALAAT